MELAKQRTDEWYRLRSCMITASDVATVLGENPYQDADQLLREKWGIETRPETPMIRHGVMMEPEAIKIYQEMFNVSVQDQPLFRHKDYPWLGASPDGRFQEDCDDKLLEIKCRKRLNLPRQYWIQVQIQLEVTDIETADLFQCKFDSKGRLVDYRCDTIARDRDWFSSALPKLEQFHKKMTGRRSRKRKAEEEDRPAKRKKVMIKPDDVKNYLLKDPILDYFELHAELTDRDPIGPYSFNYQVSKMAEKFSQKVLDSYQGKTVSNLIETTGAIIGKEPVIKGAILSDDKVVAKPDILIYEEGQYHAILI